MRDGLLNSGTQTLFWTRQTQRNVLFQWAQQACALAPPQNAGGLFRRAPPRAIDIGLIVFQGV